MFAQFLTLLLTVTQQFHEGLREILRNTPRAEMPSGDIVAVDIGDNANASTKRKRGTLLNQTRYTQS